MIVDWFGWAGTVCILVAFFLLTHKTVHSHSLAYLGLNLIGGVLLAVDTFADASFPAFSLNMVWVLIALYGLVRAREEKK